eukprot:522005_1
MDFFPPVESRRRIDKLTKCQFDDFIQYLCKVADRRNMISSAIYLLLEYEHRNTRHKFTPFICKQLSSYSKPKQSTTINDDIDNDIDIENDIDSINDANETTSTTLTKFDALPTNLVGYIMSYSDIISIRKMTIVSRHLYLSYKNTKNVSSLNVVIKRNSKLYWWDEYINNEYGRKCSRIERLKHFSKVPFISIRPNAFDDITAAGQYINKLCFKPKALELIQLNKYGDLRQFIKRYSTIINQWDLKQLGLNSLDITSSDQFNNFMNLICMNMNVTQIKLYRIQIKQSFKYDDKIINQLIQLTKLKGLAMSMTSIHAQQLFDLILNEHHVKMDTLHCCYKTKQQLPLLSELCLKYTGRNDDIFDTNFYGTNIQRLHISLPIQTSFSDNNLLGMIQSILNKQKK